MYSSIRLEKPTDLDLTGRIGVLPETYTARHPQKTRYVRCTGGFGCKPDSLGRAVFIEYLGMTPDMVSEVGDGARANRNDIVQLVAKEDELKLIGLISFDTSEVKPIDLSLRDFLAMSTGYFGRGATQKEAEEQLRKAGGWKRVPAKRGVYKLHPEAYVTDIGSIRYPKGTNIEVVYGE